MMNDITWPSESQKFTGWFHGDKRFDNIRYMGPTDITD